MPTSRGVKTTAWVELPADGCVWGLANANDPFTEALPALRNDEASVCPKTSGEATGSDTIDGVSSEAAASTFTKTEVVV